ncbi:MAG: ECF transporter S component, partial [Peptococcaceae bacterium]|nr:ECF transporter S component [Peptococcaceae bacterium]
MQTKTRYLANLALLSALAYVLMVVGRIPVVAFLSYEPKDVIIVIGGLIYGPMASFLISLVVSFMEMVTVSGTGWIGFMMNVLSTCSFACCAAFIYKKTQHIRGAVIGLVAGGTLTVAVMMLWNYLLTPIYMNVPREVVAGMLLPVFLPFNVLKSAINGAVTILIYKPIASTLRRAGLIP